MRHKKHFLRGPLNYTECQTNRKMQSRTENAFFLQTGPGKLYESCFLQKPAAPSCSGPDRRDLLVSTSSTSQLDMKGKTQRRRGLFLQRISSSPEMMDCRRRERQRYQEDIVSALKLHRTSRQYQVGQNCSACAGSGQSLQKHRSQQRQRKGQTTCKREKAAYCSIHNGLSINTGRLQRE